MAGMTTDELIAEILRHDAKATPGPWVGYEAGIWSHQEPDCYRVMRGDRFTGEEVAVIREWSRAASLDAKLIAAYRTAAPLLARRLRRAMEALRVFDTTMASRWVEVDAREALEDIEEMQ